MTRIDWDAASQSLKTLPAGERAYWEPTLERLQTLETLHPEYVELKMTEFRTRVEQPTVVAKSPGELSRQVMESALEQLRKVLRGAEFDALQIGDLNRAANRAAVWRKLASLNQQSLPKLLLQWDHKPQDGSWADMGEAEWSRARFIRAALACLQVRNPDMCAPLRLVLARALEKKGKTLRKELETLEIRCQRELGPDDTLELQNILSGAQADA